VSLPPASVVMDIIRLCESFLLHPIKRNRGLRVDTKSGFFSPSQKKSQATELIDNLRIYFNY